MAPTDNEETLSDDFEVVEKPDMEPDETAEGPAEAAAEDGEESALTAANLEQHNRSVEAPFDETSEKGGGGKAPSDEGERITAEAAKEAEGEEGTEAAKATEGAEGSESAGDKEAAKEAEGKGAEGKEATKEIPASQAGAGLLFGLSGLALGGPLLALLGGVGGAVAADPKNEGKVGEAARAAGDATMEAGAKVGAKAEEVNEEYHILDRIRSLLDNGCARVKEFDEEHRVTEKTWETVSNVGAKIKEFDEEHKVSERTRAAASDVGAKTRAAASDVGTGVVEFEKKHKFGEAFLGGIRKGMNFLVEKWREATGEGGEKDGAKADGEKDSAEPGAEGSGEKNAGADATPDQGGVAA